MQSKPRGAFKCWEGWTHPSRGDMEQIRQQPSKARGLTPILKRGYQWIVCSMAEPSLARGESLVRLTDLAPRLQSVYAAMLSFARDPKALYEMTKLQWDLWARHGLGIGQAWMHRDGVAANTGFPGSAGLLISANGPQEAQMRGMLHRHTLLFGLRRMSTDELTKFAKELLEEWMEAVLVVVQRTQFSSGNAVARPWLADPGQAAKSRTPSRTREIEESRNREL